MNTSLDRPGTYPGDRLELAQAMISQWKRVCRLTTGAILSLLLVFPPIALAAYLTDSRGLSDFRGDDWQIFTCMAITVVIGFVLFFLFLRARYRANAAYEHLLRALMTDNAL